MNAPVGGFKGTTMTPQQERAIDDLLHHRPERGKRDLISCLLADDHTKLPEPPRRYKPVLLPPVEQSKWDESVVLFTCIWLALLLGLSALLF